MNLTTIIPTALAVLGLSCSLNAQVLMLDFGPTETSGESRTNSPYHTTAGSSFGDTAWNQIQDTDGNVGPASGLVWSNGDTATGVTVDIGGNASGGSSIIDLQKTGLTSGALGAESNSDIYAGSSAATDAIYLANSGSRAVGLQVAGLSGTYDIYITARNTSRTGTYVQNIHVGTADNTNDFDYSESSYVSDQLSYINSADATANWVPGENYLKFSVTITAGEYLNIAAIGGGEESRGFLNSVQIVSAIPEPSTYAMIAGAGILMVAVVRRKVRAHRAA